MDAYQALCCAAHGYPQVMQPLWPRLSATIRATLHTPGGNVKALQAACKLLDALLRAVSGVLSQEAEGGEVNEGPENGRMGLREWEEALDIHLSVCTNHRAPTVGRSLACRPCRLKGSRAEVGWQVRAASLVCYAGLSAAVYWGLGEGRREEVVRQLVRGRQGHHSARRSASRRTSSLLPVLTWQCAGASLDDSPAVRSAACRALGVVAAFPPSPPPQAQAAVMRACSDPFLSVRTTAVWALASVCHRAAKGGWAEVAPLANTALLAAAGTDPDKVLANSVRAVGHLAACVRLPGVGGEGEWMERAVQQLLGLLSSGNVKVQWNVCHALAQMLQNPTLLLPQAAWAPSLFRNLVTLLGQTQNYKIRIQCLGALAVPCSKEGERPHGRTVWNAH